MRLTECPAPKPVPYEVVRVILEDFVRQLEKADIGQQRALLQLLVQEIHFDKGGGIPSISLHFSEDVVRALSLSAPATLPCEVTLTA